MTDKRPRATTLDVFASRSRRRRYVGAGDDGLDAISRKLLRQIDALKRLELESDDGLDAISRKLLRQIDALKRLELERHRVPRDSDEFNDLTAKVERAARDVFDTAALERSDGAGVR